jgi:hypothetical protein
MKSQYGEQEWEDLEQFRHDQYLQHIANIQIVNDTRGAVIPAAGGIRPTILVSRKSDPSNSQVRFEQQSVIADASFYANIAESSYENVLPAGNYASATSEQTRRGLLRVEKLRLKTPGLLRATIISTAIRVGNLKMSIRPVLAVSYNTQALVPNKFGQFVSVGVRSHVSAGFDQTADFMEPYFESNTESLLYGSANHLWQRWAVTLCSHESLASLEANGFVEYEADCSVSSAAQTTLDGLYPSYAFKALVRIESA